jgi:hypothetical protein
MHETASDISIVDEEFGVEKENMILKCGPIKICEKYHDKTRIINLQNAYHSFQEPFTEHT